MPFEMPFGMPVDILYFGIVFLVSLVGFGFLKRPIYESMIVAFIALVAVTGTWSNVGAYIYDALCDASLYAIIMFLVSAHILAKTGIIDDCIALILSVFGRISGGAGYVAVIGSAFMGSLSGSGPGNVATTGVFTIPAMKKSGFPSHLAANVEAFASTMGNMIPPAGMIAIAFERLDNLYPGKYTMSQYWMILWIVAIIFIIQRLVTLFIMCKHYKVKPMDKSELPSIKASLKKGWKGLLLPIIIFLPFFLDAQFGSFFAERLGEDGAKAFSGSILSFVPALLAVSAILLSKRGKSITPKFLIEDTGKSLIKVVPTGILVLFAYFISNLFDDIGAGESIGKYVSDLNVNPILLAFVIPLFCAILGMLIPGSSQVKIFGASIITIVAAAGGDPILAAAMLPCICGAMHGVTPPYAVVTYTAMGIAESPLKDTLVNSIPWLLLHYLLSVAALLVGYVIVI